MPTNLSISAIAPATVSSGLTPSMTRASDSSTASAAATSTSSSAAPVYTNPDIHIDPATNLVVMQFRNDTGTLVDQIPTQQQLDAYRQGTSSGSTGSTD
jgi:3-oxoacyl-ACP reductase-like protein